MSSEYSIAMFEDGRTDIIPNYWIQDYLKKDNDALQPTDVKNRELPEPDYNKTSYTILENFNSQLNDQINKARESAVHEYEWHMRTEINSIYREIKENGKAIKKLHQKLDCLISLASGEEEPEDNVTLPASNLMEFLAIEDEIQLKHRYNSFVDILWKIGGKTVEATTRKIWAKLCTTQLASTICWTGANGKFCLKPLKLNELVKDAVLKTHANGKESEIQRATMLWFSHAQDRLRPKKYPSTLT